MLKLIVCKLYGLIVLIANSLRVTCMLLLYLIPEDDVFLIKRKLSLSTVLLLYYLKQYCMKVV